MITKIRRDQLNKTKDRLMQEVLSKTKDMTKHNNNKDSKIQGFRRFFNKTNK